MDRQNGGDDSSSDGLILDRSPVNCSIGTKGSDNTKDDQLAHQNKPNNSKPEASAKSTLKEPLVEELAKVSYNGIVIRIFSDSHISPRNGARSFYFEPVVFLEPESIARESNKLLKKDLVRFKIKMWDAKIRSKVLERLQSLPSLKEVEIHEEDVIVMPFEKVQLVVDPDSILESIRLVNCPLSYLHLNESINFFFVCDHPSEANEIADNLKRDAELIVGSWKLALDCRGFLGRPNCCFNVNTQACDHAKNNTTALDRNNEAAVIQSANSRSIETIFTQIKDLQDQMETISNRKFASAFPVFSVETCTNPDANKGESFGFSTFVIDTDTDHGEFDLPSGIFTVKTAGIYQLNFVGHADLSAENQHSVLLKVNNNMVIASDHLSATSGHHPTVISAHLQLESGDKVGVFALLGELEDQRIYYEDDEYFNQTNFSGVLYLGQLHLSSTRLSF